MNLRFLIFSLSIALLISCHTKSGDNPDVPVNKEPAGKKEKHIIAILPFKDADSNLMNGLKTGLEKQLQVEYIVLPGETLPDFAFYKPRQRYIADSLLVFLRQENKGRYEKILGVTTKDISTRKDPYENWGILGLGSCPGEVCVVSSFRAGRNKIANDDFLRRMTMLALHELGHTYGLEHCPVFSCIMKDAKGKMNLDDARSYCEKCRDLLRSKGVL